MRGRRPSGSTLLTFAVVPALLALITLDIADGGVRRWFGNHAFTTNSIVSMLVLLITVLVVDRIISGRQLRDRSRVVAVQAAVLARQGERAVEESKAMLEEPREHADELRRYATLIMLTMPVLMEFAPARRLLEAAQHLGGLLADGFVGGAERIRTLAPRVDEAERDLRKTAAPLIKVLSDAERRAVERDGAAEADIG